MSKASNHSISILKEATAGTTPATPRFTKLPDARTTLAATKGDLTTERLEPGRFAAVPRTGARSVVGEIPADISDSAYELLIASGLQGTWSAKASPDTVDITIDSIVTAGIVEGDDYSTASGVVTFERIAGAQQEVRASYVEAGVTTNYEFNGLQTITIDGEDFVVTAYTAVGEVSTIKAASDRSSLSVLRHFSDLGGGKPYMLFAGCEVGTFNLSASANGLAKAVFSLVGQTGGTPLALASLPAGLSQAEPIDTLAFDTFSGDCKIDGVTSAEVTEYDFTIDNGLAEKFGIGVATGRQPSSGQSLGSGSITMYFEDSVLYEKFLSEASFSIEFELQDPIGNKLTVLLPKLVIAPGTQADVDGDTDITLPVNFTAHRDDTEGTHIKITRTGAIAS
tara:strand:- start:14971 stop:16155 length:1185 start_codon:yes stop_codon:yes gene_type:complete